MGYSYHISKSNSDLEEEDADFLETLTSHQCLVNKTNEDNLRSQQNLVNKTYDGENKEETDCQKTIKRFEELVASLPKGKGWMNEHLVYYKGCWLTTYGALKGLMFIQDHFKAQPADIFLANYPKRGTTWLKALVFPTMNRSRYDFPSHPLLGPGPHDCIPFLDAYILQNNPMSSIHSLPSPRLSATHIPYDFLPNSMISSGSRFVCICRNPKDVLVSTWVFMNKIRPKELPPFSLEEAFELFCKGVSHYGPFWDHVLGYCKASLESPQKILFLKYEEMKREPFVHSKRLAEFLGQTFSLEEESDGVVHEIIRLCSSENLSSLEVNKTKVKMFSNRLAIDNCDFFRKGKFGDWENHRTMEMIERLDQITEEKLEMVLD